MLDVNYLKLGTLAAIIISTFIINGCDKAYKASSNVSDNINTSQLLAQMSADYSTDSPKNSPNTNRLFINSNGNGYAYIDDQNGQTRIVHNGKAHQPYENIENIRLSHDGKTVTYTYTNGEKKLLMVGGKKGEQFYDDIWETIFSPDDKHIAYFVQSGDVCYILFDKQISSSFTNILTSPVFSADSSKIAIIVSERGVSDGCQLKIFDTNLKQLINVPRTRRDFVVNSASTKVAVIAQTENGRQRAVVADFNNMNQIIEGPEYDIIQRLDFDIDGKTVIYAAKKNNKKYLVYDGQERLLPDDATIESVAQLPDKSGVGAVYSANQSYIFKEFFVAKPRKEMVYNEASGLVYSKDGKHFSFVAARGKDVFLVADGKESESFDFIVPPANYSPDGTKIVFKVKKDNKRFVVVADTNGTVIRKHPAYENVMPLSFSKDGKSVAYGVKNGRELWWKVENL